MIYKTVVKKESISHQGRHCLLTMLQCGTTGYLFIIALDSSQIDWLTRQFIAGISVNDMWWLSGKEHGFLNIEITNYSREKILSELEYKFKYLTIINRIYFFNRYTNEFVSYKFRLPNIPDGQGRYYEKTTLLRYFLTHTSLNDYMKKYDVIDSDQECIAVLGSVKNPHANSDISFCYSLPSKVKSSVFCDVLLNRRSRKEYVKKTMPFNTLSSLLSLSAGVTKWVKSKSGEKIPFYSYPIGGGIKSTHLFMYCNNVAEVEAGYYYYNAVGQRLESIKNDVPFNELCRATAYESSLEKSSVTIFIVGDYYFKSLKYLDRAYRVVVSESGHLSQNVHLVSEYLSLKSCVVMGFNDELLADALNLKREEQSVISLLTIGY